jgi:outer membrane protein assembly factor BamB
MSSAHAPAPAFRHDPAKLVLGTGAIARVRWDKEPAVCGYAKLTHLNERLKREIAVPVCASAIIAPGAGVIVSSYDGRVRLFGPDLSEVFWERRLGGPIYSTPLIAGRQGAVVVASTQGEVAALGWDGAWLWRTNVGSPIYATPTVLPEAGLLVIATFGGRCFGIEVGDGSVRFALDLPRPWAQALGGKSTHRDPYASPVATSEGNVIICCAESVLSVAPDGALLWRRDLDAAIRASPATLNALGEIVVVPTNGCCTWLNARTGALMHQLAVDAKVVASPAVSGDFLVVGATDGQATCVHAPTRSVAWRRAHSSPKDYSSYSVTPAGDFIAVNSAGNVLCRARDDGRFLWETSQLLGLPEHDPAMDATPVVAEDGSMYCGSYSGFVYYFRFQPAE